MNILETIEELINKYEISVTYDVFNQAENGKEHDINTGRIQKYTYTIYITDLQINDWVMCESYDNLISGLIWGVEESNKYIENKKENINENK